MRFDEKMRSVFSAFFCLLKSSIILSLVNYDHPVKSHGTGIYNFCNQKHCEDCSKSGVPKCLNGAVAVPCGDLCGCCHSCVRFQDFGEPCGSQLAVRSSQNFEDPRSSVVVLATTACRKGLVCKKFICKRSDRQMNGDVKREDSHDLRTNLITAENLSEGFDQGFIDEGGHRNIRKNVGDVLAPEKNPSTFASISRAPTFSEETLTTGPEKNEIYRQDPQQEIGERKFPFDLSGHVINLAMAGREFQLIYGREALEDFNLLIKSIDKNRLSATIDEQEAKVLWERLLDVFWIGNSDPAIDEGTEASWIGLKLEDRLANEGRRFFGNFGNATARKKIVQSPGISKILDPRYSLRNLRKKRGLDRLEKSINLKVEDRRSGKPVEVEGSIGKEYAGFSVYDIVNKTPRQAEDLSYWLTAQRFESDPEEKSVLEKGLDSDRFESELNIRITGVPGIPIFDKPGLEMEEKPGEIVGIDGKVGEDNDRDFEIFVGNANIDDPKILTMHEKIFENLTTSQISGGEIFKKSDEANNLAKNDPLHSGEDTKNFGSNGDHASADPIATETGDRGITVNHTVFGIKSQLDRIETRTMIIESAIFRMLEKFVSNERAKEIGGREADGRNDAASKPEVPNGIVGNYEMPRQKRIMLLSQENPLPHLRPKDPNSEGTVISKRRLGRFLPHRSNRVWRTVTSAQNLSETSKIPRIGRRRQDRSEENKIANPEMISHRAETKSRETPNRNRQMSTPGRSSSIQLPKDSPTIQGRRKFPIFVPNADVDKAHFYNYQNEDPRLFSQDQFIREEAVNFPKPSSGWPLNLVPNRAFPADPTNEELEEEIRIRGGNLDPGKPVLEESVILLETQIPESVRPGMGMISSNRIGTNTMESARTYDDEDLDMREGKKSSDLLVADGGNSGSAKKSSGSGVPEVPLPMENSKRTMQGGLGLEGFPSSPAYPAYAGSLGTDEEAIDGTRAMESSKNSGVEGSKSLRTKRKKRDLTTSSSATKKIDDYPRMKNQPSIKRADSSVYNSSTNPKNVIQNPRSSSHHGNVPRDSKEFPAGDPVSSVEKSFGKRFKRGASMVDWLKAAQEYHELLPMENSKRTMKGGLELKGFPSSPAYPAYAGSLGTDEEAIDGTRAMESSKNSGVEGSKNLRTKRKKRDLTTSSSATKKIDDYPRMKNQPSINREDSSAYNSSTNPKNVIPNPRSSSHHGNVPKDSKKFPAGDPVSSMEKPSGKRFRRGASMVDWLKAAQEYHELLRQVRNAAMKTWLASQEELANPRLTRAKLFTREVPSYLEADDSTGFDDYFESLREEVKEDYSGDSLELDGKMAEGSETLEDVLTEDSPGEKDSEPGTTERSNSRLSQVSSSLGPRKFTITTNGNSTIRIEEISEEDDDVTWLGDHLPEGTTRSEKSYGASTSLNDGDYFDRMYESLDADDGDFDYEDPGSTIPRLVDRTDMAGSASIETPGEEEKSYEDSKEEEAEDDSTRFKRDSPLTIFKAKGNAKHDVLVWPSNWKDLIDRHLKLNVSGHGPRRTSKGRSYSRFRTVEPKIGSPGNLRMTASKDSPLVDEIALLGSSQTVGEEKKMEERILNSESRLWNYWNQKSRLGRKENESYRSDIQSK